MDFLLQIVTNKILVVGVVSWFLAQVFKCISNFILTKKFSIERLFGDGGMPSDPEVQDRSMLLYPEHL